MNILNANFLDFYVFGDNSIDSFTLYILTAQFVKLPSISQLLNYMSGTIVVR